MPYLVYGSTLKFLNRLIIDRVGYPSIFYKECLLLMLLIKAREIGLIT